MKLDPRHLEILAAVVDAGGMTEGAADLGKSQPSVSRSLSLLEARVGAPLFEPGRRPLRPTELGRALAAEGRAVRVAGRRATDLVARAADGRAGVVRVGGTPFFLDGVVAGVIAEFQSGSPGIRVEQRAGYRAELIAALESGALDMAVLPLRDGDVPTGVRSEPVLKGRNVIACRVGHPLTRRAPLRLPDVAPYPWIAPPADSPLYRDLRDVLSEIGVMDIRVSFTGGSLSAVQTVLAGSDALTVLPLSVAHPLARQKTLTTLPIRIGHARRHLCLVTHGDTPLSASAERFAAHLRGAMRAIAQTLERVAPD